VLSVQTGDAHVCICWICITQLGNSMNSKTFIKKILASKILIKTVLNKTLRLKMCVN